MGMKWLTRGIVLGLAGLVLTSCGDSDTPKTVADGASAKKAAVAAISTSTFSADQQKAIRQLVRDTLVKNPEILQEAFAVLEKRDKEEQEKRKISALSESADVLFRSKLSPIVGNPKGDVTIVEFFDYNCPFCGKAFKNLETVMKQDKKLKVVLKEYPIFGGASMIAAKAALASQKQGKYFVFHKAMLEEKGRKTKQSIFRIAKRVGLDVERLKKDMEAREVSDSIAETSHLAGRLGIRGTPAFFVGDKLIPGAPRNLTELLKKHAKDIRENGCKNC